jgi:molybdenum cofactor cytidylyltransferase
LSKIERGEIVPIILAAGSSKHLGFPKPLAEFGGRTALQIAVENCAGLGKPIVVLGCDAKKVRAGVPKGVRVVLNRDWREGQMSSLRCALDRVSRSDAFMIYPVDHPLLEMGTVQSLVRAFRRLESKAIVTPEHNRRLGHPVIIAAELREEFFVTETAREIIYRDAGRNLVVKVRTSAIYEDFDTTSTYKKCLRKFKSTI